MNAHGIHHQPNIKLEVNWNSPRRIPMLVCASLSLFAWLMLVKEPVSLCCPQLCCSDLLPFAWLKLLKGPAPFVCPQRSSQLPCFLALLLEACLMMLKDSVSLCWPQ